MKYNGHKIRKLNGYPAIYLDGKTTVYLHILEMEKYLGRKLKDGEVVHHCDGDRGNYNIENLWCFRTKADHTAYHHGSDVCLGDDGVYYCPNIKANNNNHCVDCGISIEKYSTRCPLCSKKISGFNRRLVERPSRSILKGLIKDNSFESIGRKYGVSGKAISKWCVQYGLPSTKKEIKQYSDNEWEIL